MVLQKSVQAIVYPGDDAGYVAECPQLHAVTQGATLDEVFANLREAVSLALEGEDLAELGFSQTPVILVTVEVEPAVA